MKTVKTVLAIATVSACVSSGLAGAAAIDGHSELSQCQKRFGSAGSKTSVFGYLPLKGDYFHGSVSIGTAQVVDENMTRTLFTSGSFTYHQAKGHKTVPLVLDADPDNTPPSECVDYLNEFNKGIEAIQFNWKGSSSLIASTSWSLHYESQGSFSCYLGADNGSWNIVLMCQERTGESGVQRQMAYGYEVISELNALLFSEQSDVTPASVCGVLKNGRANAPKGSYKACMENIMSLKAAQFDASFNATLGYLE